MAMTATLPRMEEISMEEMERQPRKGIYAVVYAKLRELYERDKALFVAFPTASASNLAVGRMNVFVNQDGFNIAYGPWLGDGRNLCLRKVQETKDG